MKRLFTLVLVTLSLTSAFSQQTTSPFGRPGGTVNWLVDKGNCLLESSIDLTTLDNNVSQTNALRFGLSNRFEGMMVESQSLNLTQFDFTNLGLGLKFEILESDVLNMSTLLYQDLVFNDRSLDSTTSTNLIMIMSKDFNDFGVLINLTPSLNNKAFSFETLLNLGYSINNIACVFVEGKVLNTDPDSFDLSTGFGYKIFKKSQLDMTFGMSDSFSSSYLSMGYSLYFK